MLGNTGRLVITWLPKVGSRASCLRVARGLLREAASRAKGFKLHSPGVACTVVATRAPCLRLASDKVERIARLAIQLVPQHHLATHIEHESSILRSECFVAALRRRLAC